VLAPPWGACVLIDVCGGIDYQAWKLGVLVLLLWAVWRKRRIGRALR
jgi:hypothetical protein